MKKNTFIVSLVCALAILAFILRPAHSNSTPNHRTIQINQCTYHDLFPDQVKKLGLSVDSCEGLTEIGAFECPYESEIQGIAYAHPDPKSTNLVVAMIDETPTVFQFANFNRLPADMDEVLQKFGLLSADSIRELSVYAYRHDGPPHSEPEIITETVTDEERLTEFFALISSLPPGTKDYQPPVDENGLNWGSDIKITLTNGTESYFRLYLERNVMGMGFYYCRVEQPLPEWMNFVYDYT